MKMERKFSCKIKGEGCRPAILECYLSFRQYVYALWFLFVVEVLTCGSESVTEKVFLIGWLKRQVTCKHRSLQVNYVSSTKTDIGPLR